MTALGSLLEIAKGRKPSAVSGEGGPGRRALQINDLRGDPPARMTTDLLGVEVTPTDVVVAWDGANAGTVGWGLEGFAGSTLARLRPLGSGLDTTYLGRFIRSRFEILNTRSTGATVPHLDRTLLESLKIPLPPLPEQCRIAAILDQADDLRRKRREGVEQAEGLIQATFTAIVGSRATGWAGWPEARVEDLAEVGGMRTGPFGSDLRHDEFVDAGVAVLGIDNAVSNHFAWGERRFIPVEKYDRLKRYRVKPGDVIVTIMGTTGRSAVVPPDIPEAISTKHLAVITVDRSKAEPEWLSNALHRDRDVLSQIAARNRGAIMSGLNLGLIKNLRLRRPPLSAQRQFAEALAALRTEIDRMAAHGIALGELFATLQARAFASDSSQA